MSGIKVVHCKRSKYDTYIGRPSKWGNPYSIGKDGDRDEVIAKYEAYIMGKPQLLNALSELQGKVLGCWCSPKPCHGDVLKRLVEEEKKLDPQKITEHPKGQFGKPFGILNKREKIIKKHT